MKTDHIHEVHSINLLLGGFMQRRSFTQGITFYVTQTMYQRIVKLSDDMEIGVSELLRTIMEDYINQQGGKDGLLQ
jgi:hypothetical protein